jgi:hypothetical protein
MILSEEKLLEITNKLQKIFRIQDWDIEVNLVNDNEMKGINADNILGCNQINRTRKCSTISINYEHPEMQEEGQWYSTLVHELFHLIHDDINDWVEENLDEKYHENYEAMMERNINRFTRIFTSVYPFSSLDIEIGD